MTKEEAITKLKNKRDEICNDCLHAVGWCEAHCGFSEAIDIAIEALRQHASSNAIDRQAAIDELPHLLDYDGLRGENGFVSKRLVRTMLKSLPPAHPEQSIPLSWIEEYIEQLHNARGIYSELRVNIINRMIDEWRKGEQNE